MNPLDKPLRDLAAAEDNVASRAELHNVGLTDQMIKTLVKRLRWQQLQRGVYLLTAVPPTWRQRCRAALKAAGPAAMLHGETGLAVSGVEGTSTAALHVQVLRPAQPRIRDVVVHRSSVHDKSRKTADGLRTCSIERLLLDFAAGAPTDRVEVAVESALAQGLTAERRLWAIVAEHPHRMPGVTHLTRVLEERPLGKAARSKLEIEIFTVLRNHDVPLPMRNHDTWIEGEHYEIDCAYVDEMGAVECDSRRWHGTASQTKKDRQRQAVLESWGWRFVRVTWADVFGRPKWVVEQVRALLAGAVVVAEQPQPGQRAS